MKKILAAVVALALVAALALGVIYMRSAGSQAEVVTASTLEKIVNISELSTYQVTYNGVAEAMNEKKPEKVDYYIYYEATVQAGIDPSEITFEVNEEEKCITVTLPKAKIDDDDIHIGDEIDYIFTNKEKDKVGIFDASRELAKEDVKAEISGEDEILDMAQENAENAVRALVEPFLEAMDEDYTLKIQSTEAE